MTSITLHISKNDVYAEVKKTTAYTGAKMEEEGAYERIVTTDENEELLQRFWNESKNLCVERMKRVLDHEEEDASGNYTLGLALSDAFDTELQPSMERSLFSFFVMNITAKWYTFTNKSEANGYAAEAATNIDDIMRKAYYKRKPTRPTYK